MNRVISKLIIAGILMSCSFFVTEASAQKWKLRRYEVGVGFGAMQVFGDIGGTADEKNWMGLKDLKIDETNFALSALARYKISPSFAVKTNLNFGKAQGTDQDSRNDRGRSYSLSMVEFAATGEFYFLQEDKGYRSSALFNRRGMLNNYNTFSSYLFAGIGVSMTSTKHGEAPLAPQDDYKPGANVSPVIPFGIGVKYIIDDRFLINGDFGYRYCFSDYVEGYSNIWNSDSNDMYYYFNVSLNYRLKTSRRGIPLFMDRKR